ncbi:Gfo/Idh/MocA family oxidoreductase [Pseudomonas lopnurensis]|uniref:Gfo/Idh/MocA family oxidoreductase n=1 Tax=Pseudomonas lopnurensis TaxID=1477517 RepID=UPI0028A5EBA4|nr:Gfo/Idh/MocA family oxidoreductase [Pseudomonas lopnurensis]
MVIKVGIIGLSDGNGHPYSFSAIINGYNYDEFLECGWPVILNYLSKKDKTDFGVAGLIVNAIWTQSFSESKKIAAATNIEFVCKEPSEMEALVDAVIIARDDWEFHYSLAIDFLKCGKHVFIDKPLSLSEAELRDFLPYLVNGQLMSCAALRYAVELDEYRLACRYDQPKAISACIVSDWQRYGVHLLDGIFSSLEFNVESVFASGEDPKAVILICRNGLRITLNCLGKSEKTFSFNFYFTDKKIVCEVGDNFSAFRRMLCNFRDQIFSGVPAVDPQLTLNIMKVLIAGNISTKENRLVYINEIEI